MSNVAKPGWHLLAVGAMEPDGQTMPHSRQFSMPHTFMIYQCQRTTCKDRLYQRLRGPEGQMKETKRWAVLGFAFLATVINYFDRQTLSVMARFFWSNFIFRPSAIRASSLPSCWPTRS